MGFGINCTPTIDSNVWQTKSLCNYKYNTIIVKGLVIHVIPAHILIYCLYDTVGQQ